MNQSLFDKVEAFQEALISLSTGGVMAEDSYKEYRMALLQDPFIKELLPDFISKFRTPYQFWQYIKSAFGTYADRRRFIWDSFAPVLNYIESNTSNPAEDLVSVNLKSLNLEYIHFEWQKALSRKVSDPEGAITSSRTLIETVCKYILDELDVTYQEDIELPKLYKLAAQQLNLAPEQHNEAIFRQILGGCQTVVEGLGALRNKLSDSHGKRKIQAKPNGRHAELAVNLAGTMSSFLLETFTHSRKEVS